MVKDREAWRATVHGITKSQTRLSDWTTAIITSDSGHLFLLTIHVFFRKMSIQDFSPYFVCFLVLSCMHFLYTLDINLWSVISLANISSQLVGCLFILLMVSFAMQKLLSLIRPHLFTFGFIFTTVGDGSSALWYWIYLPSWIWEALYAKWLFGKSTEEFGLRQGGSVVKKACPCRRRRRRGFDPWVRRIPWRRKWQITPVFLPGKFMDRGAWWATVHRVPKSWHDWVTFTHTMGWRRWLTFLYGKVSALISWRDYLRQTFVFF